MFYGKIENGMLHVAPNYLMGKNTTEMIELGYFPVIEQMRPDIPEGYAASASYEYVGETIKQIWQVYPQVQQFSAEEVYRLIIKKQVNSLTIDDATASKMVDYYPELTGDGSLIKVGTKINWNGVLKQAAVDLWDTAENNPDAAPTLWVDIAYREGIRIIPDTFTAAQAFALDEPGWWQDHVYRSTIAANVYTPDQYAAGWELVR